MILRDHRLTLEALTKCANAAGVTVPSIDQLTTEEVAVMATAMMMQLIGQAAFTDGALRFNPMAANIAEVTLNHLHLCSLQNGHIFIASIAYRKALLY